MKKIKHFLLTTATLLCCISASAHDFFVDGIYYNITSTENKTVEVTYRGKYSYQYEDRYVGDVIIPESVDYNGYTYSVTNIGDYAFADCASMTSLSVGNGVKNIGYCAALRCYGLTSLVIGENVSNIESKSFNGCSALISIIVDEKNTFYDSRDNCNAIIDSKNKMLVAGCKETVIPESIEGIAPLAFFECADLISIIIPNNIKSIGSHAFKGCSNLKSIILPDSINSIEQHTFYQCSKLDSIIIPNSVINIGEQSFSYCDSLRFIKIPDNVETIEGQAFSSCWRLNTVIVGKSVTSIKTSAFYGCKNLKTIVNCSNLSIKKGSENYGRIAYYADKVIDADGCIDNFVFNKNDNEYNLIAYLGNDSILSLPENYNNSYYNIGEYAFLNADYLKSVIFSNGVKSIGKDAFKNCSNLSSIEFGNSIMNVVGNAFYGTEWYGKHPNGLIYINSVLYEYKGQMDVGTSLEIKVGTTCISENAFLDCVNLSTITLPNSLRIIGDGAFSGCENLNLVINYSSYFKVERGSENNGRIAYYADKVINADGRVGDFVFDVIDGSYNLMAYWGNETNLSLPNNYKGGSYIIGSGVFESNCNLTSVIIPDCVTGIGNAAFLDCYNLESVTMSENIQSIGDWAFGACSNLSSINLPNSVASIGYSAFSGCSALKSITVPMNVVKIGEGAFADCHNLMSIIVVDGNIVYDSRDNCNAIIETETNKLISGCKYTIIPNNVTCIGESAFEASGIECVNIPNCINVIENYAFAGCSGLTSVTIPNSVTSIGEFAFSWCDNLTSVTIPSGVANIENGVFYGCSGLTSVTIPNSVTSIGDQAFCECSDLTSVTIGNTVTSIGGSAFSECNNLKLVINLSDMDLVKGSTSNGYVAYYADKVIKADGCVDGYYFAERDGKNVLAAYLGDETVLTLPDDYNGGAYVIGDNAFENLESVTSVTIPNGVASIGANAFDGCTNLTTISIPSTVINIGANAFDGTKWYDDKSDGIVYINNVLYGYKGEMPSGTIDVKEGTVSISSRAFYECDDLETIIIPSSVVVIGTEAFVGCTNLKTIDIPNGLEDIDSYAFYGCTSLSVIRLGKNVNYIGECAFGSCTELTDVYCYGRVVLETSEYAFEGSYPEYATLHVPAASIEFYKTTAPWNSFGAIDENKDAGGEDIGGDSNDTDYNAMDNVIYIETVLGPAGGNVKLSVKMKNNVAVQGYQFDLYLPNGVSVSTDEDGFPLAELSTQRTTTRKTDYFNATVVSNGAFRVLCGSSNGYTFDGNDGEVAIITLDIADDVEVGEYPIVLKEVKLSDNNSQSYSTSYMKSTLKIIEYTLGDVNADRIIDVADFISVANHILGKTPSGFISKAADVNVDGYIDVADFIGVANIILKGSVAESKSRTVGTIRMADQPEYTDVAKLSDAIYIEPITVSPGSQHVLSIKMRNTMDVAGYQFTLQLPEGITMVMDEDEMVKAELSTERTTAKRTNYFNTSMQADGTLLVLCGTSAKNPNTDALYSFDGNDGEVAKITIEVPEDYTEGDYTITIKDVAVSDLNAARIAFEDVVSQLTIGESYVLLDENSTTLPEASDGDVQIKVKRTIKAGSWSTICLPFAMTEEQVCEAFGEDVQLAEFMEYESDDESTIVNVIFESALLAEDGFFANYPYIIKTSKDVTEFIVTSTIEPDEENAIAEFTNGRTGSRKEVYGTFYGTLTAGGKVPNNCLFLNGGKFWYSKGNSGIKAFRGYFDFVDLLAGVEEDASANMRIVLRDETTGIETVVNEVTDGVWYTLQGVRVSEPTSKGIYIKDGKKVYVK